MDTNDSFDIPTYTFILLLIIWSILYHNNWDVECKAVALKWGTKGYEEHESDRPQFLADPGIFHIDTSPFVLLLL